MRDWKLESLANGKEISIAPFRTEKEESTSEGTPQFPNGISGKLPYLTSNRNFRIFSPNGKHPFTLTQRDIALQDVKQSKKAHLK